MAGRAQARRGAFGLRRLRPRPRGRLPHPAPAGQREAERERRQTDGPAEAIGPGPGRVREADLGLTRDDHHQSRRNQVRAVRALGAPARVVRDLDEQRVPGPARRDARRTPARARAWTSTSSASGRSVRRRPGVARRLEALVVREHEERAVRRLARHPAIGRVAPLARRGAQRRERERLDVARPRLAQAKERVGRDLRLALDVGARGERGFELRAHARRSRRR